KDHNVSLNGCRGGGIYLYRGFGTVIQNCRVRNFNGDGISFQQSNDVTVRDCASEYNTGLGLHPGSGSQRPTVQSCVARGNGEVAGIRIMGQTNDLVLRNNTIRDTRAAAERKQTVGVRIEAKAGPVVLEGNTVDGGTAVKDLRPTPNANLATDEHR